MPYRHIRISFSIKANIPASHSSRLFASSYPHLASPPPPALADLLRSRCSLASAVTEPPISIIPLLRSPITQAHGECGSATSGTHSRSASKQATASERANQTEQAKIKQQQQQHPTRRSSDPTPPTSIMTTTTTTTIISTISSLYCRYPLPSPHPTIQAQLSYHSQSSIAADCTAQHLTALAQHVSTIIPHRLSQSTVHLPQA